MHTHETVHNIVCARIGWVLACGAGALQNVLWWWQYNGTRATKADAASRDKDQRESSGPEVRISFKHQHLTDVDELPNSETKQQLRQAVEWPLKHADAFKRLGLQPARGALLYGPPGCSKTSLLRVIATSIQANLVSLSAGQLYSMYLGEGAAILQGVFARARQAPPALVIVDDIDSILSDRRSGSDSSVGTHLLAVMLNEMDGLHQAGTDAVVLATTNRPWAVDSALLRPGRLDSLIPAYPPDADARVEMLRHFTSKYAHEPDVDLEGVSKRMARFTGAEVRAVCQEVCLLAFGRGGDGATVRSCDFDAVLRHFVPSVSEQDLQDFKDWEAENAH